MTRHAKTGTHVTSDGGLFHWADWARFRQRYDPQWQTINNGASRFSGRRRGIDQDAYWIGIDVPEGRRLIVWSDALKLSENEYDIDVFDAPDGFTGGTEGVKRKLGDGDGDPVSSGITFGVTPANEATHELRIEDFIDTGNVQGIGRPTVSPTEDNTFQVATQSLLIRITRQGTGQAYNLAYRAVVWEDDGFTTANGDLGSMDTYTKEEIDAMFAEFEGQETRHWVEYDVGTERIRGETYTNDTGRELIVDIQTTASSTTANLTLTIDGEIVLRSGNIGTNQGNRQSRLFVVPNGSTYVLDGRDADTWKELRA